jgi:hypothetical protein
MIEWLHNSSRAWMLEMCNLDHRSLEWPARPLYVGGDDTAATGKAAQLTDCFAPPVALMRPTPRASNPWEAIQDSASDVTY